MNTCKCIGIAIGIVAMASASVAAAQDSWGISFGIGSRGGCGTYGAGSFYYGGGPWFVGGSFGSGSRYYSSTYARSYYDTCGPRVVYRSVPRVYTDCDRRYVTVDRVYAPPRTTVYRSYVPRPAPCTTVYRTIPRATSTRVYTSVSPRYSTGQSRYYAQSCRPAPATRSYSAYRYSPPPRYGSSRDSHYGHRSHGRGRH